MEQIKKPRRQLFGNEDNHLLANVCAMIAKIVRQVCTATVSPHVPAIPKAWQTAAYLG